MAITTWAATTGDWDDSKFDRGWDGPNIAPAVASLALTGYAPADSTGSYISVGSANLELVQTYDWDHVPNQWDNAYWEWDQSPIVPGVSIGAVITPDGVSLTLTASIPSVDELHHTVIPVASLSLTGYAPTELAGHLFSPGAASLTGLNLGTTWATDTSTWTTVSGNWDTGTITPLVGVTYTFTIDSAGNLVLTPYKPDYPIERQPKFVPYILLS